MIVLPLLLVTMKLPVLKHAAESTVQSGCASRLLRQLLLVVLLYLGRLRCFLALLLVLPLQRHMEDEVDDCLTGASIVDPVVLEESVPGIAMVDLSAAAALMDVANASPQSVGEDDNAASQDCPSLPFSTQQSEASFDLFDSLAAIHVDSMASLLDETGDVGESSTCTSFSDQLRADQLQELLSELPSGSLDCNGESHVPEC